MFPPPTHTPQKDVSTVSSGASPRSSVGMTPSAALQPASAFAEVDKRVVEILTLSPRMNPKRRRSALLASKKIGRRVHIRNLWSELSDHARQADHPA